MSIIQPAAIEPRLGLPPESVQPGGGTLMQLELAWGRLRRARLRLLRPAYVRRMAERRRGSCPGCMHDIVDARDLKYRRNVCGYSFGPGESSYSRRGPFGLARAGLAEVVVFSLLLLPAAMLAGYAAVAWHPAIWILVVALLAFWLQTILFFRDPERQIPTDPTALVSPADGRVTHIEEVDEPDFPGGRALRVSIFLSVFNVHVNRVPRSGRVVAVRYFRGCFLDARHADCAVRNEQLWIDFTDASTGRPLRVKQISGAIARRIVCWLRVGEEVRAGDRFGMIKFGSRTDVLIPADLSTDIAIQVGDHVKGGATTLVRLQTNDTAR